MLETTRHLSKRKPSQRDVAKEAFDDAKATLQAELTEKEQTLVGLDRDGTTFADVQEAVTIAANAYSSKPRSAARKWLLKLSQMISYYGQILDVLVQHHPEYVALAWGTFKFLFTVSCFDWL